MLGGFKPPTSLHSLSESLPPHLLGGTGRVLRGQRPWGLWAALPVGPPGEGAEGGEGGDDGEGNVDDLQTWDLGLGAGAALGGRVGRKDLQAQGSVECEALLREQLGGGQARVQTHEVEGLQANRLQPDPPQGEAGHNAAQRLHHGLGLCLGGGAGGGQWATVPVDHTHCRDGELDRSTLDGDEGGIGRQASWD